MAEELAARPADLDAAAARFDEAAAVVTSARDTLATTLAALGDYVGDDEQGRRFDADYRPKVAQALATLGQEADAVRSLAGALRSSAAEYRRTDHAGAVGLRPAGG